MLKIAIIAHAGIDIGIGHYFRTYNFLKKLLMTSYDVRFNYFLISELELSLPEGKKLEAIRASSFDEIKLEKFDIIFLDLLFCTFSQIERVRENCKILVSLSPIFNHFEQVDLLFTREEPKDIFLNIDSVPTTFVGCDYAILGPNAIRISAGHYESVLYQRKPSIGICMGGTDPQNLTYKLLEILCQWNKTAIFWVALSNSYPHDINILRSMISQDSKHEIVLATTYSSLWDVMSNCSLILLQGGVSTYEAIYAGLPSINFPKSSDTSFLLRSFQNNSLGWVFDSIEALSNGDILDQIFSQKSKLMSTHIACKAYLDDQSSYRIFDICLEYLNKASIINNYKC